MSDFISAAMAAKLAGRERTTRLVAGLPAEPEEQQAQAERPTSFDGGARPLPPAPGPTEAEFLMGVIEHSRRHGSGW